SRLARGVPVSYATGRRFFPGTYADSPRSRCGSWRENAAWLATRLSSGPAVLFEDPPPAARVANLAQSDARERAEVEARPFQQRLHDRDRLAAVAAPVSDLARLVDLRPAEDRASIHHVVGPQVLDRYRHAE